MKTVKIDGVSYPVAEVLPYHGLGYPAALVSMPDGTEKIVTKQSGVWRFRTASDMVEPLLSMKEKS